MNEPTTQQVNHAQELIKRITALRVNLDYYLTQGYAKMQFSCYTVASVRSAQMCRMWLGKCLGPLGQKYPYPESRNADNNIVEESTDTANKSPYIIENIFGDITSSLAMAKRLRALLQDITHAIKENQEYVTKIVLDEIIDDPDIIDRLIVAQQHCQEAEMWLGMELHRISQIEKGLWEDVHGINYYQFSTSLQALNLI